MTFPGVSAGDSSAMQKFTMMVKATSIPAFVIGQVRAPYWGGSIKLPGDRQWGDWQTVIINDEDQLVLKVFQQWNHKIKAVRKQSVVAPFTKNPASYKAEATIYKYGKEGDLLRTYKGVGLWPTVVGEIALGWDMVDQLTEFPVTFALDYWENDEDILGQDGSGISNL